MIKYNDPRTEMAEYLPPNAVTVLDVGCSSGEFGRTLRSARKQLFLVGIEPSIGSAERASAVFDEVVVGTFPEIAVDLPVSKFDAIFFNDVLEHMVRPDLALRAAAKLLTSGGVVIASIPNVRHISVIGPLIVRGEFRYRETGILDHTHLRFFTQRTIGRLFSDANWTIQRLQSLNRVLRVGQKSPPRWISILCKLGGPWIEGLFTAQYVVVARPCSW